MSQTDQPVWLPGLATAPIAITPSTSRSPTPRPRPSQAAASWSHRSESAGGEEVPVDGRPVRGRSDTMETTASLSWMSSSSASSSSSSSPWPQTPDTPSILGVLHAHQGGHPASPEGSAKVAIRPLYPSHSINEWAHLHSPTDAHANPEPSRDSLGFSRSPASETWPLAAATSPQSDPDIPISSVDDRPPSPSISQSDDGQSRSSRPPNPHRSQSSLRASLKRKLDRSRHSFRSLGSAGRGPTNDRSRSRDRASRSDGSRSGSVSDLTDVEQRPRTGRFRSLFHRTRRGQSESSTPASPVLLSTSPEQLEVSTVPFETPASIISISSPSVIVRDFGGLQHGGDYFSIRLPQRETDDLDGVETAVKVRSDKGKGRAVPLPGVPLATPPLGPSITRRHVVHTRSSSLPEFDIGLDKYDAYFDRKLPHELKIEVFRHLVESYGPTTGNQRWSGPVQGRRELIRLSRVSKSWRAACLDGQLWPLLELSPYLTHMHQQTLATIVNSSRKCIKTLSLKGAEHLAGQYLLGDLPVGSVATRRPGAFFPSLTNFDLRGCASISSFDIVRILDEAPELRSANFKGVQAVSSDVIRTLARASKNLAHLDVSRCWDLTLGDLVVWLEALEPAQAAKIRTLRLAGIKSYGHGAADLLPLVAERLVNLRTLDVSGCTHLFAHNFERFAEVLRSAGRVSTLQHLSISSCSSLTSQTFGHLVGLLPDMRYLEMANLPNTFRGDNIDTLGLANLLRGMPRLQKLDLEGTGQYGGVTDLVMEVLMPGHGRSRYSGQGASVGEELEELHIGFAKNVTAPAISRLIRKCTKLRILEADNTAATNSVMREFLRRRSSPGARISLVDCRAITPAAYYPLSPTTRPRAAWEGHAALPFVYDDTGRGERDALPPAIPSGEFADVPVLKTFWSWKRVAVAPLWREARQAGEVQSATRVTSNRTLPSDKDGRSQEDDPSGSRVVLNRRSNWWVAEPSDADFVGRTSCVVM